MVPADFLSAGTVRLTGRRHRHLVDVLRTQPGEPLRAGLLNGSIGEARLVSQDPEETVLDVVLTTPPPPPASLTLLLALPRPKALRRILQGVTAMGVKQIVLLNTFRVDKSYWNSPLLHPDAMTEQLCLGLEQARDTLLPQVLLRPRFRPVVEADLPALAAGQLCLAARPDSAAPCPCNITGPVVLAIGPEGGFIPFEVDLLSRQGFRPIHLGSRPLRVETAVPAVLGRLLQL
ncbi:MAG: 16S rRNA (uracil(1498)-N(3))-methyltransferase [Desulfuromonas sp.]|nr:16S rRNA (uracil(1498)-N(3))-methyltransferase [Desulfuromonas sp.]